MSRWPFLLSFIVLSIILPTDCGVLEFIWETIFNKISLGVGTFKTVFDFCHYSKNELNDMTPHDGEEFDFIVVGAGAAGAAIASRLSEIEEAKILLIEAGWKENLVMDVPLIALFLQFNKRMHWDYRSEPSDNYCLGIENRQCQYPMGKVMGGTSVMNAMMVTRGTKKNYDSWARMVGDESWNYDGMLKYLKKLEKYDVTLAKVDEHYHNFDGPVRITNVPYQTEYVHKWTKAGEELGLPPVEYNGRERAGFNYLQTNQIHGERLSSNRAYLHPAKHRKNLHVSMRSHVDKVLIDPQTKTAHGVEFTKYGRKIRVKAKKEIILSAGPFNSPKILMLSGIGPREHLQSLGIDVLVDAPVGENLMDHIAFIGLNFVTNVTGGIMITDFFKKNNPTISNYLNRREGPLSVPTGIEGIGYVNIDDPTPQNDEPNLEMIFGGIIPNYFIYKSFGFTEEHFKRSFSGVNFKEGYFIWPVIVRPKSRGRVFLRDANPSSKPKIIPNYFDNREDVRSALAGIKWAQKVSHTNVMQSIGSSLHHEPTIGCEDFELYSDDYWECTVKTLMISLWHFCGTAKMGRENDPSAVVNSKLQVIGIKNLRVADASIMPEIPTAHLNIPTMAIGEKMADILKCDWGYYSCTTSN
ncbi:hypothetical protein QAD02_019126 [Eretmocerus hayati]|uniref:Uncharacterized protein n=1 Tax=Eretmocerus hayati TaxID=131215 RepID=A0ACC2PIA6_9HYME|nr:hypothetical protein QAD02_019126 [Eretmocerus hayati]